MKKRDWKRRAKIAEALRNTMSVWVEVQDWPGTVSAHLVRKGEVVKVPVTMMRHDGSRLAVTLSVSVR